jgi:hypothetical protein
MCNRSHYQSIKCAVLFGTGCRPGRRHRSARCQHGVVCGRTRPSLRARAQGGSNV